MDVVSRLSTRNSGSTGTFGILADAAGALPISPHTLTTHFHYSAQCFSLVANLLGKLTALLGAALDYE